MSSSIPLEIKTDAQREGEVFSYRNSWFPTIPTLGVLYSPPIRHQCKTFQALRTPLSAYILALPPAGNFLEMPRCGVCGRLRTVRGRPQSVRGRPQTVRGRPRVRRATADVRKASADRPQTSADRPRTSADVRAPSADHPRTTKEKRIWIILSFHYLTFKKPKNEGEPAKDRRRCITYPNCGL